MALVTLVLFLASGKHSTGATIRDMEAQDKLAVVLVPGTDPERFCLVFADGMRRKRMGVGYESAIRAELERRGLSDDEIDALIEQGRNNPS